MASPRQRQRQRTPDNTQARTPEANANQTPTPSPPKNQPQDQRSQPKQTIQPIEHFSNRRPSLDTFTPSPEPGPQPEEQPKRRRRSSNPVALEGPRQLGVTPISNWNRDLERGLQITPRRNYHTVPELPWLDFKDPYVGGIKDPLPLSLLPYRSKYPEVQPGKIFPHAEPTYYNRRYNIAEASMYRYRGITPTPTEEVRSWLAKNGGAHAAGYLSDRYHLERAKELKRLHDKEMEAAYLNRVYYSRKYMDDVLRRDAIRRYFKYDPRPSHWYTRVYGSDLDNIDLMIWKEKERRRNNRYFEKYYFDRRPPTPDSLLTLDGSLVIPRRLPAIPKYASSMVPMDGSVIGQRRVTTPLLKQRYLNEIDRHKKRAYSYPDWR